MTRSCIARRSVPGACAVVFLLLPAAPAAAQDLSVTAPSVTITGVLNQATVSWSYVRGALVYQVMRREVVVDARSAVSSAQPWVQVSSGGGSPFQDVLPKPSTVFEYRVDAALRGGSLTPSAVVRYASPPFTTPANVAVTGASTQANISWSPAVNVTGYAVWRRVLKTDGSIGDLTQRTSTPTTGASFADVTQPGTVYEYQVVAADPSGATYPSAWVRYATAAPAAPPPAPVVTIVGAGDKAAMSWSATPGAVGYSVSRVQVDATGKAVGAPVQLTRTTPGTTFTDALPGPATMYRYSVAAVMADMMTVSAPDVMFGAPAYSTPGNIMAAGAGGRVGLTWCPGLGVAGYQVWRRTVRVDGSTADLTQRTASLISTPNFIDVLPTPGLVYEYQVIGVGLDMRQWPSAWVRYAAGSW